MQADTLEIQPEIRTDLRALAEELLRGETEILTKRWPPTWPMNAGPWPDCVRGCPKRNGVSSFRVNRWKPTSCATRPAKENDPDPFSSRCEPAPN